MARREDGYRAGDTIAGHPELDALWCSRAWDRGEGHADDLRTELAWPRRRVNGSARLHVKERADRPGADGNVPSPRDQAREISSLARHQMHEPVKVMVFVYVPSSDGS